MTPKEIQKMTERANKKKLKRALENQKRGIRQHLQMGYGLMALANYDLQDNKNELRGELVADFLRTSRRLPRPKAATGQ